MVGDSYALYFLPTIIIGIVIGIMANIWLGAGIGFLAIGISVLAATHSIPAGIPFIILSFISFGLLVCFISFKNRIVDYISEGKDLQANLNYSTYSTTEYIDAINHWNKKVAKDIRRNKGKSAESIFQDSANIQLITETNNDTDWEKRYHAAQKLGFWIPRLEDLQRRL